MCGLLGHIGNKSNKVNIDKFNILGILNETRGTDSCGVALDGEILKGVDYLKKYRDFVTIFKLAPPTKGTGIIGHTRKSTIGVHTEANAHPFGFGGVVKKKGEAPVHKFVGAHNGTLLNHTEIATKRNISLTKEVLIEEENTVNGKKIKKTLKKTVTKIDSELLLECLYKDKNYSVLSEYNGAAALIWQDMSKPNVMFFYHGKSKKDSNSTEIVEERPLHYYQENKNSLYVSSIEDSLYIIGGNDDEIGEFEHNVVYEVKDGNLATAKKTKIDRKENYKVKGYNFRGGNNTRRNSSIARNTRRRLNTSSRSAGFGTESYVPARGSAAQLQLNLERPIDKGILSETFDFDPNLNKGITVCKQLRYWRNGHLAKGVYGFIDGLGFFHLGVDQKGALSTLSYLAGVGFWDKEFHVDINPNKIPNRGWIPFPKANVSKNPMSFLHYMYDGIRFKTYIDYLGVVENQENSKVKFDTISLSISAAHPIIDLNTRDERNHGAYYGGELANRAYTFLGSSKIYRFAEGQIKDISYIPGEEPEPLVEDSAPFFSLDAVTAHLEGEIRANGYANLEEKELMKELCTLDSIIEKLKQRDPKKVIKISDEIDNKVDNILLQQFSETEINYKKALDDLSQYKSGSTKAKLASNILTKLIKINE